MSGILDGFSLVWVLMYRHSKSTFYRWLKILNWRRWILVVNIPTQILLTLLTFIALLILLKVSIWRGWFLFGVRYYENIQLTPWRVIMDTNMVSKIWLEMSTTNNLIQNSKSLAKTGTLNAGTSELISEKKRLKFLTLHSPFCLFIIGIL